MIRIGWVSIRTWSLIRIIVIHALDVLAPSILYFSGRHAFGPTYSYQSHIVLQSAVLFCGSELFEGDEATRYVVNLILHFAVAICVGGLLNIAGFGSLYYFDNGHNGYGGNPIWLFPVIQAVYLFGSLPLTILWVAVRWIETNIRSSVRKWQSAKV